MGFELAALIETVAFHWLMVFISLDHPVPPVAYLNKRGGSQAGWAEATLKPEAEPRSG